MMSLELGFCILASTTAGTLMEAMGGSTKEKSIVSGQGYFLGDEDQHLKGEYLELSGRLINVLPHFALTSLSSVFKGHWVFSISLLALNTVPSLKLYIDRDFSASVQNKRIVSAASMVTKIYNLIVMKMVIGSTIATLPPIALAATIAFGLISGGLTTLAIYRHGQEVLGNKLA